MRTTKFKDALTALIPHYQLQRLLNENGKAGQMYSRVSDLAKLSPEEAFMLIHKSIRKSDMFKLITLLQTIYNIQQQMKIKYQ